MTDTSRTSRLLFSFAQCLRHAFFSGVGYGDSERISAEDQARWTAYDPPKVGSFASVEAALHENESLRARVAELETPDQFWDAEDPEDSYETDPQYVVESSDPPEGVPVKLLRSRSLPVEWGIALPTKLDEDGAIEESVVRTFPSEEAAMAAFTEAKVRLEGGSK